MSKFKKHFRRNNSKKVRGHPTYIYKKINDEYYFVGITHAPVTNRVKNIKLDYNPNPNDSKHSYIRPFSSKEKIKKFSNKELSDWKINKKDRPKFNRSIKNFKK